MYFRFKGKGRLIRKGFDSLVHEGPRVTWRRVQRKAHKARLNAKSYRELRKPRPPLFTQKELEEQRSHQFPQKITFSIIVPLYNTPKRFLEQMLQSVLDQTYANWQLCLADGSDGAHEEVERVCREYAARDERILYQRLEQNLGISGNTNACLAMATGDYLALFDHDDLLHPAALHEVMRAICDTGADFIYTDEDAFHHAPNRPHHTHFKPDFAPDNLRANNYICHLTVFSKTLLDEVGPFDPSCDGSQDHDMILRLTEKAQRIAHIPMVLYHWRAHRKSTAQRTAIKPYVFEAGKRAIERHLERVGLVGTVSQIEPDKAIYRVSYAIEGAPTISIIIPNCDHLDDLTCCLDSLFAKTTYPHYEVVIVENNSLDPATFAYYDELCAQHDNVRVVTWPGAFNYSAINNFGAQACTGEYLLLLNNDIEVISPDWLQEMLMYAQRKDVGAVGAKLYYPDDTIQHAGVGLGMLTLAGHLYRHEDRKGLGYMGRLIYAQDLTAVTAACMMVRRDVWDELGGLDEDFAVAFNDIDFCMRVREAGYLIVWTPFAELYHYESKSRGAEDTPEKKRRFQSEVERFWRRWDTELAKGDPYLNPNFSLESEHLEVLHIPAHADARVVDVRKD